MPAVPDPTGGFIPITPSTLQPPWEPGPGALWLREVSSAVQGHTAELAELGVHLVCLAPKHKARCCCGW